MFPEINKDCRIKGIKIRTVNIIMLLVSFVLCLFSVADTIDMRHGYEKLQRSSDTCIKCREDAQMAKDGSYYLTEQVHFFVMTGEPEYAANYFTEVNITGHRDKAIQNIKTLNINSGASEFLISAMQSSDELMNREIYAMRLVVEANGYDLQNYDTRIAECTLSREDELLSPEKKIELARRIVFDSTYLRYRNEIDSKIQTFIDETYRASEKEKSESAADFEKDIFLHNLFTVIIFLVNAAFFVLVNLLVLRPLKHDIKCIRERKMFENLGAYEFRHLALTYNNIFEASHENEKILKHKVAHDDMTGLINKGYFERISAAYTNMDMQIALLVIDIDRFKTVNDTYGHTVGDRIIRSVGQLLFNSFRPTDVVARIGGDEFAVIMSDVTFVSAENIRIKIRNLNNILAKPKDGLPKVSLSVGAAFSEYGYCDALFENADKALYNTKANGRAGCTVSDEIIKKGGRDKNIR